MYKNSIEFEVLVKGQPLREYFNRDDLTFIEGKKGSEFSIRVRNNTCETVLAVITVDGLSIIDGEKGDMHGSPGYILKPYQTEVLKGWRISDNDVAKFEFSGKGGSYSAKSGKGSDNAGVISCAVFKERCWYTITTTDCSPWLSTPNYTGTPWPPDRGRIFYTSSTTNSEVIGAHHPNNTGSPSGGFEDILCCSSVDYSEQNLGTKFGDVEYDKCSRELFNRDSNPFVRFDIYYDDRDGLEAKGVDVRKTPKRVGLPKGFAQDEGFCKPPNGWCK